MSEPAKPKTSILPMLILVGLFAGLIFWMTRSLGVSQPKTVNYSFVLKDRQYIPDTVKIKLGSEVTFSIDNQDNEQHGLHLAQFGIIESIPPLQKSTVQFTANQVGTVYTTCSSGHPENITVIIES